MNALPTPIKTPNLKKRGASQFGEPVWGLAHLFPYQGAWTEEEYLTLDTNLLIEFTDGYLEVLSMPIPYHQFIVAYLYDILNAFVKAHQLGRVLFAPLRVRIGQNKYREPDIVFVLTNHAAKRKKQYWDGADLVMEIVSESQEDRERDYIKKRAEYAQAGISEYWIVDPQQKRITVLHLAEKTYAVHGEFETETQATSVLLPGFSVSVTDVFNVEQQ